ncbi:MAG: hypothetical protein Q8L79_06710 [Methylobacter sp.]|uniref:hypothetical protein n=1 Tax=Methylobacter sp. TaxID=2051955 RepID=UPI002731C12A|nr:hypothetical protein [Methylobacter sp.]MDP1664804.1 hypothetical protein [Methylobacter sp.]
MIIKWMTTKARQFLPLQDAGFDELNVSFDFALSPEIMNWLFAQNDDCTDAGGRATHGAVADDCTDAGGRAMHGAIAETGRQAEDANATAITQFALDEYELALA